LFSLTTIRPSYADDPDDVLALAPQREGHRNLDAGDAADREPAILAPPRRVSTIVFAGEDQHAVEKVEAMDLDVATSLVLIPFELDAAPRTTIRGGVCQALTAAAGFATPARRRSR
jgi:hypothetical protein